MIGTFHGTEYEISVTTNEESFNLNLVCTEHGTKWSKAFNKSEIENLTFRTKSTKKFNVFCKMLLGSLENTSQSTMIDILSPSDMELLKSRKIAEKSVQIQSFSTNKRINFKNFYIFVF